MLKSSKKPWVVRFFFGGYTGSSNSLVDIPVLLNHKSDLNPDFNWRPKRRRVVAPILRSKSREKKAENCSLFPWQLLSFPTCNIIHELGMGQQMNTSNKRSTHIEYINSGYHRDVWRIGDRDNEILALKTLVMGKEFTYEKIDKQRQDAIISERSTASDNIAEIFAYCGTTALNEFAFEGTLEDAYPTMEKKERLRVAVDVAKALADLHSLGSVVHADVAVRQYLRINGRFKLNDFNTSGMMRRNDKTGDKCPFKIGVAGDKNRAPEEMLAPYLVTEAIDVYSMGNIFWKLLTNERKYDNLPTSEAQKLIIDGKEPELSQEILSSSHIVDTALKNAIKMCLQRRPENRKRAEEVHFYLSRALAEMDQM